MIKANNLQDYSNLRLQKSQENYLKTYEKCASIEEQSNPLIEIVASVALAGVIIYAHERITHGQLTTGAFVSFMAAMAFFMDPVRKFTDSNIKMQRGLGSFDRLTHFLGEPVEKNTSTYQHPTLQSEINIENLSFSYGDQKVLQNFSLKIHKGQKVALVGLSGSGKSTLINLLLRFYPTTTGKISLDGRDITDFELENYRRLYALVSQDLFLFNETILENLTTGQSFDENKLWNALSTAHAKDFIQQLPEKLETPIGDRGLRLSGGQAQRVTIARAVLRDAPILLFDEATSALDNESEKIVQEAIDKISGNKTVITVAHRLSTIQNYDKIVVLKDGRKVEEGTHQELISLGGEYKKLYDLGNR